jgi:hypothetical protein
VSGTIAGVRACRVCGCTEHDCRRCVERTGEPCCWVDADLCSACVGRRAAAGTDAGLVFRDLAGRGRDGAYLRQVRGYAHPDTRRVLRGLVEAGLVEATGRGRNVRVRLTPGGWGRLDAATRRRLGAAADPWRELGGEG